MNLENKTKQNITKFNSLFKKDFSNYFIHLIPESYLNVHTLIDLYPNLNIPKQGFNDEIGFAKLRLDIYMSHKKHRDLSEYISTLNDKEIVPLMNYYVYLPLHNGKVSCDNKNFHRLAFNFMEAVKLYYIEWDKVTSTFKTPEINPEFLPTLEKESINLISKSVNKHKIWEIVEKQLKKTIIDKNFVEFDMSMLPQEYDIYKFISIPTNKVVMSKEDNEYIENVSVQQNAINRFLKVMQRTYDFSDLYQDIKAMENK